MAVTEKRQLDDTVFSTKHILMDIEGTTTSISFVKDTLFPYVRKNLESYLGTHWNEDEFKGVLNLLKDQAVEDLKANLEGAIEIPSEGSDDDVKAAILKNVLWQMDADRKTTALKKLQGHMWRQGYKTGELKGHLFADVAPSLREWLKEGHKLYVYSSGSVEAQKLLFGNSVEGDLTELFTDFFDTAVGAKVEADSYKAIVEKLECNADDVLFLTDLPKEASAARQAGLPVVLVEREGNEPIAIDLRKEFSSISSFQEICFENSSKKQKIDSEEEHPESVQANGQEKVAMEIDVAQKVEDTKECDAKASGNTCSEPMDTALPSSESNAVDKKESEAEEAKGNLPKVESTLDENQTCDNSKGELAVNPPVVADESDSVGNPGDCKSTVDTVDKVPVEDKVSESVVEETDTLDAHAVPEAVENETDDKTDAKDLQQKTEEETVKGSDMISDKVEVEVEKEDGVKPEEESVKGNVQVEKVETDPVIKDETEKDAVIVKGDDAGSDDSAAKESDTIEACKDVTNAGNVDSCEAVKTPENVDSGDRKHKELKSEEVEKVIDSDESNGKGEVEEQGKTNGVTNGTNGTEKEGSAGTNGTVENGHSKLEDVAEVIVAKNNPQIDNSTTDASVAVAV